MNVTQPTFDRENELLAKGYKCIAGVDEAGRGPLAGPVVAAAVILPPNFESSFSILAARLDDSKKLKAATRESIYEELIALVEFGIGSVDASTIDEINIRQASWRAMQRAVADLESRAQKRNEIESNNDKARHMSTHVAAERAVWDEGSADSFARCQIDYVLIDGLPYGEGPWPYEAIVKGDSKSLSIAAASIVAKESRDQLMREMDALHPQYGFARHKGYGSPQHLRALAEHGPCAIHRLSFAPVKRLTASSGTDAP